MTARAWAKHERMDRSRGVTRGSQAANRQRNWETGIHCMLQMLPWPPCVATSVKGLERARTPFKRTDPSCTS